MKKVETAVFGGGCFWRTEAVFKMLKGVERVTSGYAGQPSAEVVKIDYDPELIKYEDLLTVFFAFHDPTTMNRQGNDVGTQYRSVIFYTNESQKTATENFIADLNNSSTLGKKIVTEISPFENFYEAEDYHRDYYATHPGNPYCEVIINPKLEKVQQRFAELLKARS